MDQKLYKEARELGLIKGVTQDLAACTCRIMSSDGEEKYYDQ